ncbi:MAG: ATP-binding protein [Thermoguttaceae bacterium]
MRRSWLVWTGFLLCLAVVLTAMAWVSVAAVRLDRAEAAARRQAALEERVRLALWRADSALAPLVAQESVRPWFAYRPFLPADRAYGNMFNANNDRSGGERVLPSPLLAGTLPHVLVHFQFEPDGRLTSPQVPGKDISALAGPLGLSDEKLKRFQAQLAEVQSLLDRKPLLEKLPASPPEPVPVLVSRPAPKLAPPARPGAVTPAAQAPSQQERAPQQPQISQPDFVAQGFQQQAMLPNSSPLAQTKEQRAVVKNRRANIQQTIGQDAVEFDVRSSLLAVNNSNTGQQLDQNLNYNGGTLNVGQSALTMNGVASLTMPSTDLSGVPMTPLWIRDRLILARRITAGGQEYLQGCLLDWPGIKAVLLETINDLLPEADFEPVTTGAADVGRMLASLPVRLLPGRWAADGDALLSPILLALAVAWTCAALAAVAVAGLLAGVLRLSERRAAFVTAVTHELRTPLTTFQMYAEMLAEGMVPEGPGRQQYLATLRSEAVRLTHLVENVLSYARLERGRADGHRESLPLGQLIGRMIERLGARAEHSGMQLSVDGDEAARAASVRANPSAVEQILFNLMDNACKYASGGPDPRLCLLLALGPRGAEVSLADHGPGVSASVRRRLFRPFSKSAREAAHSAPGVGLGLALSRRLARDMGGDLRLDPAAGGGARFVLVLPLARDG